MDEERFAVAIGVLGEAFRQKISATTIRAYRLGLRGISIEAIEKAITTAIEQKVFMPVPAELRELAGIMRPEDRALLAWNQFQKAMMKYDYYETVQFDDPIITATVRLLWRNWMYASEAHEIEKDQWLRKQFIETYCSLMRTGIDESASAPLLGYYEHQNILSGHPAKPPVLIACGLLPVKQVGKKTSRHIPKDIKLLEKIGKPNQSINELRRLERSL